MQRWVFAMALCVFGCRTQDESDQAAVRRLCDLPPKAELLEWRGFPARSGFGQREGLDLAGTFRVTESPGPEQGYTAGPVAAADRKRLESLTGSADGLERVTTYRCATAGDDVLRATRLVPCASVPRTIDLVWCAYEAGARVVRARVRSAY